MRVNFAIAFVRDMKRSVAFYRDVLGMPLRFEPTHWTEFATDGGGDGGGATLALHLTDDPGSQDPAKGGAEPAGRCRPGLRVDNLDNFHARMLQHKVPCVQPPKQTFGVRIAQYVDPDGLVFSASEDRRG